MARATTYFTDDQRKLVEQAVAEAESKTSAEIVPVVATASGRYDRPEDIVGLFIGLLLMAVTWLFYPRGLTEPGSWAGPALSFELPALVVALVVGFAAGAFLASRVQWLRTLFTPKVQMRDEVDARARQVFFDDRVHHTAGATGILFYVSLCERTAVLLADAAVLDKLGQGALDELCADLVRGIREGDVATALSTVIRQAGGRLESVLPRAADDVNELADTLVLID